MIERIVCCTEFEEDNLKRVYNLKRLKKFNEESNHLEQI